MKYKRISEKVLIISVFLLYVLFTGCTTISEHEERSGLFAGQMTLFLKVPEKPSLNISFDISSINIISEDGISSNIMNTPLKIDSKYDRGRQIPLGEITLPEGRYSKIQFMVDQALIMKKGRVSDLAIPSEGIISDIHVDIKRKQNATLFLDWNVGASVTEGYLFRPEFSVKEKRPELSAFLVYVSNEDSNNVSVINRQSGEIAATILVGKRPRGIAVSSAGERSRVYVANSGSDSITVIDPTTNKIEQEVPVRFGRQPVDIAVASVSSGKELIFVANYNSNNVSVIDGTTYQELEKVNVGRGPISIEVDPPVDDLVRTRFLSIEDINTLQRYREKYLNVYVVNHDSNEVSVLRIDIQASTIAEVLSLSVDWKPVSVYVDYLRGKAYVANYGSDKLSVIDILKIVEGITSGAVSVINNVGSHITGVISDPSFDRIYLLNERAGEIDIMKPFADDFDALKSIMPPIMGTIFVGSSPRSFILDPDGRKFFVVNRGSDTISIINKTTRREEQVISVGGSPYGIAAFTK